MKSTKAEPQNENILVVLIKKSLSTLDFILLHGNKIQLAEICPIWNSKAELKAELIPNQGVLTQTYPKEAYGPRKTICTI